MKAKRVPLLIMIAYVAAATPLVTFAIIDAIMVSAAGLACFLVSLYIMLKHNRPFDGSGGGRRKKIVLTP